MATKSGLYHVNDSCFQLFSEIVYEGLYEKYSNSSSIITNELQLVVCRDPDVLRHWSICSIDLPSDKKEYVLQQIVQKWITVRGHSLASKFMEQYKEAKKTLQEKGVREELKKQTNKKTKRKSTKK